MLLTIKMFTRGLSISMASATAVLASTTLAEPIDLSNLPNYENQGQPAYITRNSTPPNNQISDEGATLGRVLFYDNALSRNQTVSCSTCHVQSHGFADDEIASTGVSGTTGRHSMRLINTGFAAEQRMFWDERADSVEDQASQPIRDHAEMGFSGADGDPTFSDLITRLEGTDYYAPLFQAAFGDESITEDRMQRAIAQFVRSIQSFDSRYDEGRAQRPNDGAPFPNFTQSENNGKSLFINPPQFDGQGLRVGGGVGCAACHAPPEFDIDPNSRGNGVITKIGGGQDLTNTRSPSLRDLLGPGGSSNGPFMHDGSFASLTDVIGHYNAIPDVVNNPQIRPTIDPRLLPAGRPQRLQLTVDEVEDIVAFLTTLSGENVYTDSRWSNPFDDLGNLVLVGLNPMPEAWYVY